MGELGGVSMETSSVAVGWTPQHRFGASISAAEVVLGVGRHQRVRGSQHGGTSAPRHVAGRSLALPLVLHAGRRSQTSGADDGCRCCQPTRLPTTPSRSPCLPWRAPLSPLPSLPFHSPFPFSPFLPLAPPPSRLLCGALIFPSVSETLEENERASS